MNELFDDLAPRFAKDTDDAIRAGRYVRGDLFVGLVKAAVRADGYVLDFGCGPGRLAILLAQAGVRVHGVDTSIQMIAEARRLERSDLPVKFDSIETPGIALEPKAYDAIV